MLQGWVRNGDIRIHYLDNTGTSEKETPLVIIPGLTEADDDYEEMIQELLPRRTIVITLRGRGQSDAPKEGYTLEDHVSDIEAVINNIIIDHFILFGYSRGVSYALAYAIENRGRVKGLIIGDYPAVHTNLRPGWADFFTGLPDWKGKSVLERVNKETLERIEAESEEIHFKEQLKKLDCPFLIIRGGLDGAALTEEGVRDYMDAVPNARVRVFEKADHNLFTPDSGQMVHTFQEFFQEIDQRDKQSQ
ncbi:alpha/beta fold hydrolase [Bacillus sp. M6-12]|uniref:alpha/beta fold hydrolase n=1 Tax=Bacillus sp. M6-12 TaxID=2054166 RepID=UPI0015E07D1E|nr:alpha/beta hydrolase [Bacillus sp. M6-12]